ncbi:MAG: glyoxylate/hydroxypyruvate reductase A [Alphaproteobacteria bacterium]|nr:glyoxylate/hydroxypyruvate reductase A [Alphaproteobacteria bacterium]
MTAPLYIAYHSVDHSIDYWQKHLSPLVPGIELVHADEARAQEAEVLLTWNPPEGMVAGLKNLKGVVSLAQGVDHVLNGKTFPSHLKFARLIDPYMSEAMAEWVMLTVLEYHRDVPQYRAAERRKDWIRLEPNIAADTTVAIMGLGAIGSVVATTLTKLKFNVIGWSRSEKSLQGVTAFHGDDGFDACLTQADIIVSILPLTTETENIYNSTTFSKMKPGAAFINSGRGKQVVEDDLIAAVDSGHLRGATLDVMRVEPLPTDHGFWDHPKINVWPHVSAQTHGATSGPQIAEAIADIRAGRDPRNSVNIARGY